MRRGRAAAERAFRLFIENDWHRPSWWSADDTARWLALFQKRLDEQGLSA